MKFVDDDDDDDCVSLAGQSFSPLICRFSLDCRYSVHCVQLYSSQNVFRITIRFLFVPVAVNTAINGRL